MEITEERRADVLILPNPKPAITKAVSEDGETESRGHPSTEVALRPRAYAISPSGGCGVASKARPHCPRLQGSLASRVQSNIGLGLPVCWTSLGSGSSNERRRTIQRMKSRGNGRRHDG